MVKIDKSVARRMEAFMLGNSVSSLTALPVVRDSLIGSVSELLQSGAEISFHLWQIWL